MIFLHLIVIRFFGKFMPEFWPEAPHLGQQLFLLSIYCYALFIAAGRIAKGCDILRDTYGSGIVGSVLLPLLGAVPDGIIILVSGLAASGSEEEANERISIALGSLVGATVLLTSLAPCVAIFLGSVALHDDGAALSEYRPIAPGSNKLVLKPVLPEGFNIFRNGVNTLSSTPKTAAWLMLSCLTYVIIQVPALIAGNDAHDQRVWLIIALVVCLILFATYLIYMWRDSDNASMIEARRIHIHKFLNWGHENKQLIGSIDPVSLFKLLDTDNDGALDAEDLHRGLRVLGLDLTHREARAVLNLIDVDGNISIQLNEFVAFVKEYILADTDAFPASYASATTPSTTHASAASAGGIGGMPRDAASVATPMRSATRYGATDAFPHSSSSATFVSTYVPGSFFGGTGAGAGTGAQKHAQWSTRSRSNTTTGLSSAALLDHDYAITIPSDAHDAHAYAHGPLAGSMSSSDIGLDSMAKPVPIARGRSSVGHSSALPRAPSSAALTRTPSSMALAKPSLTRPGSFIPLGSIPTDDLARAPLLSRQPSSAGLTATPSSLGADAAIDSAIAAATAAASGTSAGTSTGVGLISSPKYIRRESIYVADQSQPPVLIFTARECDDTPLTPAERAAGPPPIDPALMTAVLQWYRGAETHPVYVRVGTRQRWAVHLWASRTHLGHLSEDSEHGRVLKLVKIAERPCSSNNEACTRRRRNSLAHRLAPSDHARAPWLDKSLPRFANASSKVLSLARRHADNPLKGVFDKAMELTAVAFQQHARGKRREERERARRNQGYSDGSGSGSGSGSESEADDAVIVTPSFTGVTIGGLLLFARKYELPLTPKQVKTHFFSHDSDLDRELAPADLKRLLEDLVEGEEQEEEEEEEVGHEHSHGHGHGEDHMVGWTETQKKLYGVGLLLLGTLIILLFSDPTIEVISAIGSSLGIKPFYLAFTVTPVAANASELITALFFAMGKSDVTMTLTLNSTLGANVMNNTFCVAIFLLLLLAKDLAWVYSAEVVTVLLVQLASAFVCMRQTLRQWHAILLGLLYPFSIALIYVLENVCGLE